MLLTLRGTGRTPGVVDQVIHGTIVIEGYIDYLPQLLPWLLPLLKEFAYQPYVHIVFKDCEHIS